MKLVRILHLEDDANDAELVAMHLAAAKFPCDIRHVKSEKTFASALDEGVFDLILADNSGPSFNGFAALSLARKKLPTIPFVFLTGADESGAQGKAIQSGASGYVLKQLAAAAHPLPRECSSRNNCVVRVASLMAGASPSNCVKVCTMKDEIKALLSVQERDLELDRLSGELAAVPKKISEIKKSIDDAKKALEEAKKEVTQLQLAKKQKELDLDGQESAVRKHSTELNAVKTNEAYKALVGGNRQSQTGKVRARRPNFADHGTDGPSHEDLEGKRDEP